MWLAHDAHCVADVAFNMFNCRDVLIVVGVEQCIWLIGHICVYPVLKLFCVEHIIEQLFINLTALATDIDNIRIECCLLYRKPSA